MRISGHYARSAVLCCGSLAALYGQSQGQTARFEVAAIKPAAPLSIDQLRTGAARIGMRIQGDRVDIGQMTIRSLILQAYRLEPYQLIAPDWTNGSRFDIMAKVPAGSTREQVPEMLKDLLAERFGLITHRETKTQRIYALLVGKGGPKLQSAPEGAQMTFRVSGGSQGLYLFQTTSTLAALAHTLSSYLDRPVIDKTGLTGVYSMTLTVTRGSVGSTTDNPNVDSAHPPLPDSEPVGKNFVDAIRTLGLRLDPVEDVFDAVVVDHVETKPSAN